jgi:DNA polymerase elongation subunit (family B)
MLDHIKLEQVMVLDIETVPQYATHQELPQHLQKLWEKKTAYQRQETDTPESFYERAGIWAEFGKIVCIAVGIFHTDKTTGTKLRVKSFAEHDEKILLGKFIDLLNQQPPNLILCAHNGKEFDFPYLCRRMLINELRIPAQLQIAGKKPWEINHVDTLELWKFGDYKHYSSLNLLAAVFNIPTPKDDIDGSDVCRVYWQEQNLERIAHYCKKDVITAAQVLLKYKGIPNLQPDNIVVVN